MKIYYNNLFQSYNWQSYITGNVKTKSVASTKIQFNSFQNKIPIHLQAKQ